MKKKNFLKIVFSITGVLFLGKILGFVKQIIVADAFGTTIDTDLISLSEGFIANTEYALVQTLATAFVSVYVHVKARNKEDGKQLVSDSMKLFLSFSLAIVALFLLTAPFIAKLLAPSYSLENSIRLTSYLRMFSPLLLFFVFDGLLTALLNGNEKFIPGQMNGMNLSVIMIAVVLLFKNALGVNAIVLGYYGYIIWNTLFLGFFAKNLWSPQKGNPIHNKDVHQLLKMMLPLFIGYAMIFINQQVDKIIVSGLSEGTVTAMGYAAVLSNFVSTLIGAFCTVLYTKLTKLIASENKEKAAKFSLYSVEVFITLLLPISIITVTCSNDIVTIVFAHGAFGESAVHSAAMALSGYGFCFVPYAIKALFARVQYGEMNTKSPMINSSIGILFNICFSILLSRWFGVFGVTVATSISELVCAVLNAVTAKKINQNICFSSLLKYIPFWGFGSLACFLSVRYGASLLVNLSPILRFLLLAVAGGGIYLVFTFPLIFSFIKRKNN